MEFYTYQIDCAYNLSEQVRLILYFDFFGKIMINANTIYLFVECYIFMTNSSIKEKTIFHQKF